MSKFIKFNKKDKEEAIKMYREGKDPKEIFKKLFPQVNTDGFQKRYCSKMIDSWKKQTERERERKKEKELKKIKGELRKLEMKVALLEKESVLFPTSEKR